MTRPVIIYYMYSYIEKFGGHSWRDGQGRAFVDFPTDIESADELKEWVDNWELEKAKEILERDIDGIDNVSVYVRNIVKV